MRRMFSLKQLQEIADSEVKKLVESGTLENAKPLYYHPVIMVKQTGDLTLSISLIIINNDKTAFTSWDTLKNWVESNGIANLNACGEINTGDYKINLSHIYYNGTTYRGFGIDILTGVYTGIDITNAVLDTFVDSVNKVN
ncbi:MAG: hypothetical protein J6T10_16215 [Methanobrevibacter sp.]|nr:hypothetical protein [Methanobrevibacter sp.]